MFCPQCGAEYRPGFDRCADCDVALTHEPPPEKGHEAVEYETVLETSSTDVIPVIKSLFESAEIPYRTEGEDLMNLFPSAMLGALYKPAAEVKFKVPANRAQEARDLLDAHPEDP